MGSTLLLVVACGGGGSATPTTTVAATTTTTAAATTTAASTTTTSVEAPTTTAAAGACHGTEVENPAIIAVSAADGSPCWSALSNSNASAVGVADGRLLVTGNACAPATPDPVLVAIDTTTGNELWRHQSPSSADSGSDVRQTLGTGAGVVIPPATGRIEALSLATGQVLWTREGVTSVADGPDTVAVASDASPPKLALLDRTTGQERWTAPAPAGFVGGLAVDATVVLAGGDSSTAVYDAKTGHHLRDLPIVQASDTPVARLVEGVATGVTGTGAQPNATEAYDAASGQHLWTNPGYPPQRPEPTDGNVYVVVDAGVAALDPHTGAVRWTVEGSSLEAGPGLALTEPALDSPDAKVEAIDTKDGQVRWTKSTNELGLPGTAETLPSGFTIAYQNVLPSSSGVFFAFGDCLGS